MLCTYIVEASDLVVHSSTPSFSEDHIHFSDYFIQLKRVLFMPCVLFAHVSNLSYHTPHYTTLYYTIPYPITSQTIAV